MPATISQYLLIACLVLCLASFTWAMQRFFVRPAGATAGMNAIGAGGLLFGILHVAALGSAANIAPARAFAAAALYFCSLGLFWWAIYANLARRLSACFSPDAPQHLVQHGPYRLVRHPLYCSYLLTWLAAPVATGSLSLLLTFAAMAAIYFVAARTEEKKFSQSPLAGAYQQYRSRTGLFFPAFVPLALAGKNSGEAELGKAHKAR